MTARVLHVHAGTPQEIVDREGRTFVSAVRKHRVDGRVAVTADGLAGDRPQHPSHGGPNLRLHAFASEHYPWFSARAGRDVPPPAFGENLTLAGAAEDDVRVGDVVRVGTATLQVSQPTIRCETLGRSLGLPDFLRWIQERGATGWYLRVLEPGDVGAGDAWDVVARGRDDLTVARLNDVVLRRIADPAAVRPLLDDDALTPEWRASVARRHARAVTPA